MEQYRKGNSGVLGRQPSARARRKFLKYFPKGFYDDKYLAWERDYKWDAQIAWRERLGKARFAKRLGQGDIAAISLDALRIESRTNLLFSFEKMALRDATKTVEFAGNFAIGLYEFLYGRGHLSHRFERWVELLASLPRRQTRVLTWPSATVFGFIALPDAHFFFKPNVTKEAARRCGVDLAYQSRPSWEGYQRVLNFADHVSTDISDLRPRDMIDIQSYLWVQGSDEYPD